VLPDLDVRSPWIRRGADLLLCLTVLVCVTLSVWNITGLQDHVRTLMDLRADDVWFEADVSRVYNDMTDRGANHYRTTVHPLFPLLTYPVVHASQKLFHVSTMRALRGVIAATAGIWLTSFYLLLRMLRCRRLDAALFALVAAATSGAMFWAAIPETYEFGSLTILGVLWVAAVAERGKVPVWLDIAIGAASLSVLVTNFMVAIASFVSRYRLKQAIQIAVNAFVVVVVLWGVQKYFFTTARFFIGEHDSGAAPPSPRATAVVVMLLHNFVAPEVWTGPNDAPDKWLLLTFQHVALGPMNGLRVAALISWGCLLGFAVWALARLPQYPRLRLTLALSIAGQIALHLLYGVETFLYALDFLPLLVTAAALATLSRWRPVVLAVACVFAAAAGLHNSAQMHAALDMIAADAKATPAVTEYSGSSPRP